MKAYYYILAFVFLGALALFCYYCRAPLENDKALYDAGVENHRLRLYYGDLDHGNTCPECNPLTWRLNIRLKRR